LGWTQAWVSEPAWSLSGEPENPDSRQPGFGSGVHHWLPYCWVSAPQTTARSGLSAQSESAELYWNCKKKKKRKETNPASSLLSICPASLAFYLELQ
jgi:hypothetical protein